MRSGHGKYVLIVIFGAATERRLRQNLYRRELPNSLVDVMNLLARH
ncbi:MAG: hypothetical protein HYS18_09620 [Burkholderiales bacterium]|nr:hypothetical protein [Burkholderiales bacterium]